MKKIILKSNKNLEAQLWHNKNSDKGIVVAHGFRFTFEEPGCLDAIKKFYSNGYSVLAFNFIGHGDSSGKLREFSYKTASENVSSAINYLKSKNINKVGVYACSIGTIASVLSNEKPDVQDFINPTPLYDPKSFLKRYSKYISEQMDNKNNYIVAVSGSGRGNFELGKEFIREMQAIEQKGIIKKFSEKNIPTLVIQGTADESYSFKTDEAKELIKHTKTTFLEIPNAGHDLTNYGHRKKVINLALNWFNEKLK